MADERNVASSTQNQALCALVFLYKEVLHSPPGILDSIKRPQKYRHVPVVLSEQEVKKILFEIKGVKALIVSLLYGSGLRISECLRLRIQDIDFDYNQIDIRNSKGSKDRITMMPERLERLEYRKKFLHTHSAIHLQRTPLKVNQL